jgi:hypothetical protein
MKYEVISARNSFLVYSFLVFLEPLLSFDKNSEGTLPKFAQKCTIFFTFSHLH